MPPGQVNYFMSLSRPGGFKGPTKPYTKGHISILRNMYVVFTAGHRPIDRAAGTRRRHIFPHASKKPIICSYLLGERNVSFEKRTQARTAQRRDCPGLVLQMAFSLIDESPEKRSAENLPQILRVVFENTALNKKKLP